MQAVGTFLTPGLFQVEAHQSGEEQGQPERVSAKFREIVHRHLIDQHPQPLFRQYVNLAMPQTGSSVAVGLSMINESMTVCFSSAAMSHLLYWRNAKDDSITEQVVKRLTATLSLPLLALTSVIESIVYVVLELAAYVLTPFTPEALQLAEEYKIDQLRSSSLFTVYWSLASVVLNVQKQTLPVFEFHARLLLLSDELA